MTFLNTPLDPLARVKSDHSVACVAVKEVDKGLVFHILWSSKEFNEWVKPDEDFPKNVSHRSYVKLNGQWYQMDWWLWFRMRYLGLKHVDAMNELLANPT